MRSNLNSMSVDELWSLHEQTVTLLASKMLEKRRNWRRDWDSCKQRPPSARGVHTLQSSQSFAIPCDHQRPGRAAESSRDGFWLNCGTASRWKIFGYALPEGERG